MVGFLERTGGFSTSSGGMGGMEKARQRGIPRFFKGVHNKEKLKANSILLNRLKEAPMEERELEIVDLGGKETSEERVCLHIPSSSSKASV